MQVFEGGGGLPHGGTFNGNPVTMLAGMATMEGMTRQAFEELNTLGDLTREGFREAFASAGVTGQVTGQGSLMRLHLTDRPLTNYRNVYPMPEEGARMTAVHRHLLNAGFYLATYGLICLSTVNTREEIEGLIAATVEGILAVEAA
jgi:glutamate-1-semialdehyde 2,1-aminomutase